MTFQVDGDKAETFRVMNALEVIDISNNLGDAKSLVTHPATTTHRRLTPTERAAVGITDGTIRLSVGLEEERVPPFIQDSLSYPILARAADAVTGEAREDSRSAAPVVPASGD